MRTPAPTPKLGCGVYLAPTAYVAGDVVLGDQCTIMHQVVIRGDTAPIRIGRRCNIQDGSILHTDHDEPLEIGDDVSVGHRSVLHGRSIGAGSLIGIGATILQGAVIGEGAIVAPGALVPPGAQIKPNTVVMGIPARTIRETNNDDRVRIKATVDAYIQLGIRHAAGEFPNIVSGSANA